MTLDIAQSKSIIKPKPDSINTKVSARTRLLIRVFFLFTLTIIHINSHAQCWGTSADCDGDGIANVDDLDDDNDGILDSIECPSGLCDTDNDGISNDFDLDSDDDGCFDALEGTGGFVHVEISSTGYILSAVSPDGVPTNVYIGVCPQGIGSSQNGGASSVECDPCNPNSSIYADSDSDGVPDGCDLDDDNDGILDSVECLSGFCDTDMDGTENRLDLDSDGDGCADAVEGGASFSTSDLDAEGRLTGGVDTDGIPLVSGTGQSIGSANDLMVYDGCGAIDVLIESNAIACPDAIVPYHITLTNNSAFGMNGFSVHDQLPLGFTFLYDSIHAIDGATASLASSPSEGQSALSWSDFNIPPGGQIIISYDVLVEKNVTTGDKTNSVTMTAAPMNPDMASTTYNVSLPDCQEVTLSCEPAFYQVYKKRGTQNTFGKLNVNTQQYDFISFLTSKANALGYDRSNNMAYGANGKKFISLDEDGKITYLGVDFNRSVWSGDMDTLGNWWGKEGSDMVRINIAGLGLTRFAGQGIPGADMAYNLDGNFYSVSGKKLYKFDTNTYTKIDLGNLTGEDTPSGAFGAQWTGKDGHHYISNNNTGQVFRINVTTREARLVMITEGGLSLNDGFSCPDQIPAVYESEFGDNANYPSAGNLISIQDINNDETPDFSMAWAGQFVSGELTANLNSNATADSRDDGLAYSTVYTPGQPTTFALGLNANTSMTAHYGLYIDWDNDNNFDEFKSGSQTISSYTALNIDAIVPSNFTGGVINVRLRVTEEPLTFSHSSGFLLIPGEVEDYRFTATVPTEICGNGLDDDGDGFTDCADSDCSGSACGEVAYNGFDDDNDGDTDPADSDIPFEAYNNCYEVNSNADTHDDNPGDGICADQNGDCSLRAAIEESNATNGYNCVNFNITGDITLTSQLIITEAVAIDASTATGFSTTQPAVKIIDGGFTPILIQEADDVLIRGIDLSGAPGDFNNYGIQVVLSTNVTLRDNRIRYRERGIVTNNSGDIVIRDNDLIDSGNECWDAAIYFDNVSKNTLPNGLYVKDNLFGGQDLDPQTILHVSNTDGVRISDGTLANTNIFMDGPFKCWHPIRLVNVTNATVANMDLSYPVETFFGIGIWTVNSDNVVMDNLSIHNRARAVFVDGGSNHIISNSDMRDSGEDVDNATLVWHNYDASGQQDVHVYDNVYGKKNLEVHTLLTLRNSHNFLISDGSRANNNIELPQVLDFENPIRLHGSDYNSISNLDFSYTGTSEYDNRGIWLQDESTGNVIEENMFKGRASALHMESALSTTVQCNSFTRNRNALTMDGSSTTSTVKNNTMECNQLGIYNRATATMDAKQNYWGDVNGSSSYSGIGDYYFGNVDASTYLPAVSGCEPVIASGVCVQEICDNGIDDDGDGLIDCEDGACLTTPDCSPVSIDFFLGSALNFTFNESSEQWFVKNTNGANLYPVKSTLTDALADECSASFIPAPPSGSDFIFENDVNLDVIMMSSPRLNGIDLSIFDGHMIEWYWYTGTASASFGSEGFSTDMRVVLENSDGLQAQATVYTSSASNQWNKMSVSLDADQWTLPAGTDWVEFLSSAEYVIVQVDAYAGGLQNDCAEREFYALDDFSFTFDSDGDGYADVNDLCPLDPLKVDPGHCGCGNADLGAHGQLLCDNVTRTGGDSGLNNPDLDSSMISDRKSLNEQGANYIIYPNPTEGVINIEVPEEQCTITMYDLNHRLIEIPNSQLSLGLHQIDISHEPKGVYILVIAGTNEIQHHQVVRQ